MIINYVKAPSGYKALSSLIFTISGAIKIKEKNYYQILTFLTFVSYTLNTKETQKAG